MSAAKAPSRALEAGLLALAVALSLAMLRWLAWRSHFGFEFTDEGFDLNWIARPGRYGATVMLFGFVYHPVFDFLGGNVVALRQANIGITYGLAWLLCFVWLRGESGEAGKGWKPAGLKLAGLAAIFACGALALFDGWLVTPNYNGLALQALMICACGMLLAQKDLGKASLCGWALIGLGGWLAFMAKPSTAAALPLPLGFYLLLSGKFNARLAALAAAVALILLLASAWHIDGSVGAFVQRLSIGLKDGNVLEVGHSLRSLFRLDRFELGHRQAMAMLALAVSSCAATLQLQGGRGRYFWLGAFALLAMAGFGLAFERLSLGLEASQFQALAILGPTLGILLAVAIRGGLAGLKLESWALALSLASFPYLYALGTNRNYWQNAGGAGIFWMLGALSLLRLQALKGGWSVYLPSAIGSQAVALALLTIGMSFPYRQPQALREDVQALTLGPAHSHLLVAATTAAYLTSLQAKAEAAGFSADTPVIDLSGRFPGATFALGGIPLGFPWLPGAYKGSDAFAALALSREACTSVAPAWILIEPKGPRALSPEILKGVGMDLKRDYTDLGPLQTPAGEYPDAYEQHLYKPRRSPATAAGACEAARALPHG